MVSEYHEVDLKLLKKLFYFLKLLFQYSQTITKNLDGYQKLKALENEANSKFLPNRFVKVFQLIIIDFLY